MATSVLRLGVQPSEWKSLTLIERAALKREAVIIAEQAKRR